MCQELTSQGVARAHARCDSFIVPAITHATHTRRTLAGTRKPAVVQSTAAAAMARRQAAMSAAAAAASSQLAAAKAQVRALTSF